MFLIRLRLCYCVLPELLVVIALVVTFVYADKTVKSEVSKQTKRELGPLGVICVNIAACILLVHFLCGDSQLYHRFVIYSTFLFYLLHLVCK